MADNMPQTPSQPASAPQTPPPPANEKQDIEQNKLLAAIGYLGILFVVPLLAAKNSPYAMFHAKQGLVLFIIEVVLGFIPMIGWAAELVLLVVSLYAAYQAYQGLKWELPVVGEYAKKINL